VIKSFDEHLRNVTQSARGAPSQLLLQ
jgi:hypothetical protein